MAYCVVSMEFWEGIDVDVEEDFVEIGDIQLPNDDPVQCGSDFCVICNVDTEECLSVVSTGLDSIRSACLIRQRDDVMQRVSSGSVIKVHRTCRRKFCDNRDLKKLHLPTADSSKRLRSSCDSFDWKESCYLCGKVIDTDVNMRKVTTFEIQQTVEHACVARGHDDWAMAVLGRIQMCSDLVAADAIYHLTCHSRFCDALTRTPNKVQRGRRVNQLAQDAFDKVCDELESTCERGLYTLQDFRDMMFEILQGQGDENVYSVKYIKHQLEKNMENIYSLLKFWDVKMLCFRDFCNHLVSDAWYSSDDDEDTVAVKKVKEAATLIRAQIREMEYNNDEYPNSSDLYLEKCKADVPSLLHVFINSLVPNVLKTVSIAQSLIQASLHVLCR